jgi:hypothetical protein
LTSAVTSVEAKEVMVTAVVFMVEARLKAERVKVVRGRLEQVKKGS